jgi:hypothetical protein
MFRMGNFGRAKGFDENRCSLDVRYACAGGGTCTPFETHHEVRSSRALTEPTTTCVIGDDGARYDHRCCRCCLVCCDVGEQTDPEPVARAAAELHTEALTVGPTCSSDGPTDICPVLWISHGHTIIMANQWSFLLFRISTCRAKCIRRPRMYNLLCNSLHMVDRLTNDLA